MAEIKFPEWLPEFVHELGAYLSSRTQRNAAGHAGTLVFFQNGMLAHLTKISRGNGEIGDQENLKKLLDETEAAVNPIIERLIEARDKIASTAGGVGFAHDIDQVVHGKIGKLGIRERIDEVINTDLNSSYLPELAKQICNEIDAFNKGVKRLGEKAERWGLDR